jgi:hypothetical protein
MCKSLGQTFRLMIDHYTIHHFLDYSIRFGWGVFRLMIDHYDGPLP